MCPLCLEPMIAFELEGVEVDRCVGCGGTWLDAGELAWIAERAGVGAGRLSEALERAKGSRHGKRRCPRCRRKLRLIHVETPRAPDRPIDLDRCPKGHGLWFDRGEMEAFVTAYEQGEEGAAAAFFADFLGKGSTRGQVGTEEGK